MQIDCNISLILNKMIRMLCMLKIAVEYTQRNLCFFRFVFIFNIIKGAVKHHFYYVRHVVSTQQILAATLSKLESFT